ncbi:MAG: HAMP domain-containing histidine kinase [Planctomycetaceae bacterium]|jgi:two-component system, OmpR family, phosphate regulon sensor histidine kinase PhoR|nr:HAMP domain-containing histidine kinase [Planctomycetaceae bacterium]MBT6486156.1 HAMP domain-containing histidine kinase [Planctomycetaceae bacterium]MBT6494334.1 HAMP domain-containing histidine kinase [Planctomycetaceae bacterium]
MVYFRKRRRLRVPVTLNVVLMSLNVVLMVLWIVLLAQFKSWVTLTIGTIVFSLILIGLVFYLVLTIKEIRLNQRQANFVDSVTHELKSPIASLQLYLETLQMRKLDTERREEFYRVMEAELGRLDQLISQLLEVGRLDAIGQESEPEDIDLAILLRKCAETACAHHKCSIDEVFSFDLQPAVINGRRLVLEMIFRNLLDNAIKYGSESPAVDVRVEVKSRGRVVTRISDNGKGVEPEIRKKIFRMFYRGGSELERTQKGTGLGLYIVRTLAHMLKGQVSVHDQADGQGSTFEVELPGRAAA